MSPEISRLLDKIEAALPEAAAVYVFGSAAEGRDRADSDIDFAVCAVRPIPAEQREALRQELALAAQRDVDLIDLAGASTILQIEVLRAGLRRACAIRSRPDCSRCA